MDLAFPYEVVDTVVVDNEVVVLIPTAFHTCMCQIPWTKSTFKEGYCSFSWILLGYLLHHISCVPGKLVWSKFCRIFSTAMQAGHYGGAAAPQAVLLHVPTRVTVPYWIVQPLQSVPLHGLKSATTPHLLLTIIAGGRTRVIAHLPGANPGMSACLVTWPRTVYSSLLANDLQFRRRVTRASVRPIYWLGAAGNL